MAFESLSERLGKAFKNITGKGKLSEKNMNDMLREVRMSLLEADVNYGVVKDFPRKGTGTGNGGHDLSESGADGCKNRS